MISYQKIKKVILFIARIGLAVGIIAWLIWRSGDNLLSALKQINLYWLGLGVLVYMAHIPVTAFRWRLLLKTQNIHIGFLEAISLTGQGLFFSLVIPGGALGGDLVKAGIIAARAPKGKKLEGTFSILIDRVTGMIALFSLVISATALFFPYVEKLGDFIKIAIFATLFACVGGLGATLALIFHRQIEKIPICAWIMKRANNWTNGMLDRLSLALDAYKGAWKVMIFCVVISIFFVHFNIVVIIWLLSLSFNSACLPFGVVAIATLYGLLASLLPFTPAGVGTRDTVITEILTSSGMTQGEATAIPLIFTGILLAVSLCCGLFFILQPRNKEGVTIINQTESAEES